MPSISFLPRSLARTELPSSPQTRFPHNDSLPQVVKSHKGIAGNEKADEWAKIAAEKPSTRGVENPGPLPRSLASLKWEISENKWAEARSWAGGRISKAKHRMAKSQKPDSVVADSTKRLASRFYQLKTGHARIGQYLHWAKVRPDAQCWWCKCPSQTRDHLFKVRPEWEL